MRKKQWLLQWGEKEYGYSKQSWCGIKLIVPQEVQIRCSLGQAKNYKGLFSLATMDELHYLLPTAAW